jgi:putative GTP pyrophosphokinase
MLINKSTSDEYRLAMLPYSCALKTLNTQLDIINEELAVKSENNPIEHVKSRLKSPQSMARKLIKRGIEPTIENAIANLDDIAGMRIICSFPKDIYEIAEFIANNMSIKIVLIKDYIKNPKSNGYRSYHMHVEVPVYMFGKTEWVKVEIQIRTIAMDFWASLEHKIRYKKNNEISQNINNDLAECAELISVLDKRMQSLNNDIEAIVGNKTL